MKRVPLAVVLLAAAVVVCLPRGAARAAESVKHRFLVVDNSAHRLIYVDQHDPGKGWSVSIPGPKSRDLQVIPGGKVLASHPNGAAEYDLATGGKGWAVTTYKGVNTARRLPNGNTLLGANARDGIAVYEVDRAGKEVSRRVLAKKSGSLRVMRGLANGNLLLNLSGPSRAVEIDPKGKIVWQYALPRGGKGYKVLRLPNGNTLVSTGGLASVVEVDAKGKVVATFGGKTAHPAAGLDFASGFDRLDNGHVVIANWLGHGHHPSSPHVVEFDRANTLVWQWGDHKLAKVATNVLVLDGHAAKAPGKAGGSEKGDSLFRDRSLSPGGMVSKK